MLYVLTEKEKRDLANSQEIEILNLTNSVKNKNRQIKALLSVFAEFPREKRKELIEIYKSKLNEVSQDEK